MKLCHSCGTLNYDTTQFCMRCATLLEQDEQSEVVIENTVPVQSVPANEHAAPVQSNEQKAVVNTSTVSAQPVQQVYPQNRSVSGPLIPNQSVSYPQYASRKKKPLQVCDLFAILGFVAAIVGMFVISIILHPLAATTSFLSFVRETRFKGLAIAGFVIAVIGGIVYLILSLYHNNLIPDWITYGAFH